MTTEPMYYLNVTGNQSIEISHEQLSSILGEIETQLHQSKVYRRAVAKVQQLLGDSAEVAKQLLKVVGREAIGLAFFEFAKQQQEPTLKTENATAVVTQVPSTRAPGEDYLASKFTEVSQKQKEDKATNKMFMNLTKPNKKLSPSELAAQKADEQRQEQLRQIGTQLRQLRQAQGLSLEQLQRQTFIPLDTMAALENGNLELLPEDVYVRGFIRRMGTALGIDGVALAGLLPATDPVKTVVPNWMERQKLNSSGLSLQPMHLYFGYTALVAGAVGGLAMLSQQSTGNAYNPDVPAPAQNSGAKLNQQTETTAKPGLKSTKAGVVVGTDMAPPEEL